MWRFVDSAQSPLVPSLNGCAGRQTWEWDPEAGTPEQRREVQRLQERFAANRRAPCLQQGLQGACTDQCTRPAVRLGPGGLHSEAGPGSSKVPAAFLPGSMVCTTGDTLTCSSSCNASLAQKRQVSTCC